MQKHVNTHRLEDINQVNVNCQLYFHDFYYFGIMQQEFVLNAVDI